MSLPALAQTLQCLGRSAENRANAGRPAGRLQRPCSRRGPGVHPIPFLHGTLHGGRFFADASSPIAIACTPTLPSCLLGFALVHLLAFRLTRIPCTGSRLPCTAVRALDEHSQIVTT